MLYAKWLCLISSVLISVLSQRLAFAESMQEASKPDLNTRIGQLFMLGVRGESLDQKQLRVFRDLRPGGIVLFRRNFSSPASLRKLTSEIYRASGRSYPLIAVDQEGGAVSRIETTPKLPSARWWGFRASPELSEELGFEMGRVMLNLGINMNLAPVLDVSGAKSFLRSRSYSSDADVVTDLGPSLARGFVRAGVLPTAKHFPGLGRIENDPHLERVEVTSSRKELYSKDLLPFQNFAQIEPSAMMLSHSVYTGLDRSRRPATYSSSIVDDLLRTQMNYEGLVLTDDLLMAGASSKISFGQRVVDALKAGSDMILIAWSEAKQREAFAAVSIAVQKGEISISMINKKFNRIQKIKRQLLAQQQTRKPATDPEDQLQKIIKKASLGRAQPQHLGEPLRAEHAAKTHRLKSQTKDAALVF